MLKNYIKIAWRNLRARKTYTAINIIGLAVGLAACFLIGLYVQDELSYDEFHPKQIVRIACCANLICLTFTQLLQPPPLPWRQL